MPTEPVTHRRSCDPLQAMPFYFFFLFFLLLKIERHSKQTSAQKTRAKYFKTALFVRVKPKHSSQSKRSPRRYFHVISLRYTLVNEKNPFFFLRLIPLCTNKSQHYRYSRRVDYLFVYDFYFTVRLMHANVVLFDSTRHESLFVLPLRSGVFVLLISVFHNTSIVKSERTRAFANPTLKPFERNK